MILKNAILNIIKNKDTRAKIMEKFTKNMDDEVIIYVLYFISTGKIINWHKLRTFNEKIQWYKINYRSSLMTKCADKALVYNYVEQCGLKNILIPLYGIFNNIDEINFEKLPSKCYIKCNHNSNGNYLWDRSKYNNINEIKYKFRKMMNTNYFYINREWAYKNIKPKLLVQQYINSSDKEPLGDYNFFCFNGKVKMVFYNEGLADNKGKHTIGRRIAFDENCHFIDLNTAMKKMDISQYNIPYNYQEMKKCAEILSRPFPFVRVDFFYQNKKFFFGEMTFYSASGYAEYKPLFWNYQIGKWFDISNIKDNVFK